MASANRLERVLARFQNLPAIALPTDYPRPSGANKVIEAVQTTQLSEQVSLSLLKLALHEEDEDDLEEEEARVMLVREAWAHHWMKDRVLEWKVASRDSKVLLQTKSIIFIH